MVINWDDRTSVAQGKYCRKISEEGDRIFFKTKQLFADRDSKKLVANSDDSFDFINKKNRPNQSIKRFN